MNEQELPPGWDETRIREVLDHYESQDEDERAAEIEAAWKAEGMTLISVPTDLVPEIRAILARKQTASWAEVYPLASDSIGDGSAGITPSPRRSGRPRC